MSSVKVGEKEETLITYYADATTIKTTCLKDFQLFTFLELLNQGMPHSEINGKVKEVTKHLKDGDPIIAFSINPKTQEMCKLWCKSKTLAEFMKKLKANELV